MNPYLGMLRESERHLRDIAALLAMLCDEIDDLIVRADRLVDAIREK